MSDPVTGSVEYWAKEKPSETAIVEANRTLSWSDWNNQANRLACALKRRGITEGDIVVARTQIRIEWAILQLALGKLGCRLLGQNWRLTPEESKYVLSNSGAVAIICDDIDPSLLKPALETLSLKAAVSIDTKTTSFEDWETLLNEPADEEFFAKDHPPLIVYTSGTTGLPKGVEMNQPRAGSEQERKEYFQSMAERRSQVPGDVVLVTMPLHHGAGPALVRESTGKGNLQIFQRRYNAEDALSLIEKYKITYWNGVPTMYKRMAALSKETQNKYKVSSIRSLSVGAAPVTPELKQWISDYFGECLSEGYGSTETSMITSISAQMQKHKPGSSGLPYKHVKIEIRDDQGNTLPTGETGEIWVWTPVTITAYLNTGELDTETSDENGFFRTGDVGRLDEDGYLYITDRTKDMIISGGVNIYPAEIEVALQRHPAIQDSAVIGIPHDEFGEQVKAFCELKPGQTATEEELAGHCIHLLASYKRPRSIEIVKELPRNDMGKILKKTLREPYWKGRKRQV